VEPVNLEQHPFATFAGTWRGRGEGSYPSIEGFAYTEELVVEPVPGRPVAHWRSRTRDAGSGEPRHAESGFLRSTPAGVELVIAHSFGIIESAAGSISPDTLEVTSDVVPGTGTAQQVERIERRYELDGTTLRYTVAMAAVGYPTTHHLAATLERVQDT
jgi:hypothetical protein